ncbi:MAG TPA: Crp/Fnr family transcriptional regulator, partial [Acidobacteriota bacterium]
LSLLQKHACEMAGFLDLPGKARNLKKFGKNSIVFSQGDPAKSVLFIQKGNVKLSVINQAGKVAVVAILGPGDFFGERCLGVQSSVRMRTATAETATSVLVIEKNEMMRLLHEHQALSARFIACMLARNIRVEENLIEQFFSSTEKRLASKLLLLAQFGKGGQPQQVLPKVSPETLAGMIGVPCAKVTHFMNKFKKLGFINDTGGLTVNRTLLNVVLQD